MPSFSFQIVKLKKSLYGLCHAPKLWHEYLGREMTKVVFRRLMPSDCLFIANRPTGPVIVIVYVDELLIFGSKETVSDLKKILAGIFTLTDLGECKYFLGIKIDCPKDLPIPEAYTESLI